MAAFEHNLPMTLATPFHSTCGSPWHYNGSSSRTQLRARPGTIEALSSSNAKSVLRGLQLPRSPPQPESAWRCPSCLLHSKFSVPDTC